MNEKVLQDKAREKMKNSDVIICGIVRNCAKNLKKNIPLINTLCDLFNNYHIVIFENDSVDNTKALLQQWQNNRKNIHLSINTFNTITIPPKHSKANRFFSQHRIEKMAMYRNKYLEYIGEHQLTADYIIVVDLDVRKIYLDGIINSFAQECNWDAIAANGYIYSPSAKFKKRYNDTYALVECGMENTPQTELNIRNNQYAWAFLKPKIPMIPVFSAFGGLCIYKYKALSSCRYNVLKNNDERVEVRCEHFSIHVQMQQAGHNKTYINPNMRLKYSPYIFSTILQYLKNWNKSRD